MNMSTTYFRPKAMNAKESPHSRTRIFPIIVDISGHIAIGMIGILQWEKNLHQSHDHTIQVHVWFTKRNVNTTQNKYSNTLPGNTWQIGLSYDINVYWWWNVHLTKHQITTHNSIRKVDDNLLILTTLFTFLNSWNGLFFVRKWKWAAFLSQIS